MENIIKNKGGNIMENLKAINLRPSGIIWENKTILMISKKYYDEDPNIVDENISSKTKEVLKLYHLKDRNGRRVDPKSEEAKNSIIIPSGQCASYVEGQWCNVFNLDVNVQDNYVSIVPVHINGYNNQENLCWEEFLDKGIKINIHTGPIGILKNLSSEEYKKIIKHISSEIRLYNDGKIIYIIKLKDKVYALSRKDDRIEYLSEQVAGSKSIKQALKCFTLVNSDTEIHNLAAPVSHQQKTISSLLELATGRNNSLEIYTIWANTENHLYNDRYTIGCNYSFDNMKKEILDQIKNLFNCFSIKNFSDLEGAAIANLENAVINIKEGIKYSDDDRILIYRAGDSIIMSQYTGNGRLRYITYNVKKKTCWKTTTGTWNGSTTPVNIANDFGGYYRCFFTIESYNKEAKILFEGNKQDIFKGTIIEHILSLGEDALQGKMLWNQSHSANGDELGPVSAYDIFYNTRNKDAACFVDILCTARHRVYEHCIKSGFFHLFSYLLNCKHTKINVKEQLFSTYNQDAKNLKDCFNLSLKQIKILDEYCWIKNNKNGKEYYQFPRISLNTLAKFGIHNYNQIDPDTFKRLVIWLSGAPNLNRYYYYYDRSYPVIADFLSTLKLQDKVSYCEKYLTADINSYEGSEKMEIVEDYLRMRKKLKELGEDVSGYPCSPSGATKFIRYFYNMRLEAIGYNVYNRARSESDFVDKIVRAKEDNKIDQYEFVKEGDHIVGARIIYTPKQIMLFLHNELSIIWSMKENESKQKDFLKAIDRVRDLEYTDEKLGLQIVAPKHVNDISNEGRVLSHCVASYIDPICSGSENIMFIRRTDKPNDPYFTLDITNNDNAAELHEGAEIRQIHCYDNGDPTDEGIKKAYERSNLEVYNKPMPIIQFLLNWIKENPLAKKIINPKSIKDKYSWLCAKK